MIVAPSILSADMARLSADVLDVEVSGADWHHVDVMDGHFVPPLTFGLPIVKSLRQFSKLPLDVHIMVANPLKVAADYAKAGAHRVTFHIEATDSPREVIQSIRAAGAGVGVALNPKTPAERVLDCVGDVDHILIMSVEPGYAGQVFISDIYEKIEKLSKYAPVIVDGGINPQTAKTVREAGATGVVAGSWVYGAACRRDAIAALRS